MKKFLMILLLAGGTLLAQNTSEYKTYYYGDGEKYSDSLRIEATEIASGEYYVNNSLVVIWVDSNWTASNIGFLVYNELESVWEPLSKDGSTLEYQVGVDSPVVLTPAEVAGIKRVKFLKITSGTVVEQATNATNLQIATIRFN